MNPKLDGVTATRRLRSAHIRNAVHEIDTMGKKPTSRNVLAWMDGHDNVKKFPQGMGGKDLLVFRDAMRNQGYMQNSSGMWKMALKSVGLDEVLCDCPISKHWSHVMTDHEAAVEYIRVGGVTVQ